jgi:DNA replication protein DnaC
MELDTATIERIKNATIVKCPKCGGKGYVIEQAAETIAFPECSCVVEFRSQISYTSIGIPRKFWEWDFDSLTEKFKKDNIAELKKIEYIKDSIISNSLKGSGLFIQGTTGVGKSAISAVLIKIAAASGLSCYYTDCNKIIRLSYEGIDDPAARALLTKLADLDIIVLDELDKPYFPDKRVSFGESRFREYFGDLDARGTFIIGTSNRSKKWLAENKIYDFSVLDRISALSDLIFTGDSFRRGKE